MNSRRTTPRPFITTGKTLAVGLLLASGAWQSLHAEPAPDAERPPAAAAGADDRPGPWTEPGVRRPGPPAAQGGGGPRAQRAGGGRGGRGGRGGDRGPDPVPLTEDQVEDAVALMIELDPAIAPRIEQLRAERPELLRRALSRRFPRLGYMLNLKESRPALYALRVSDIRLENLSHEQARTLAALPDDDPGADAARAALRATLEEHFGVRQEVRRAELAALRDKIVEMEAGLVADERQREALVQQRLVQLEADPPPPGGGRGAGDGDRRHGRRGEGPRGDERREAGRPEAQQP